MFCRGCDYSLLGLDKSRCPECGLVFDLTDPRSYAARPWRVRRRRLALRLTGLVVFGLVLWWLDFGYSWSWTLSSCSECAARLTESRKHFFIIPIWISDAVDEGPISTFVQTHEGVQCRHVWVGASGSGGGLWSPARWQGRGRERYAWSRMIDVYVCPYAPAYLEEKAATDNEFAHRLITLIRADYFDPSDPLCQEMLNELSEIADQVRRKTPTAGERSKMDVKSE